MEQTLMTTSYSHRPWTTLAVGDGAAIKDALGNQIAVFSDRRDAELAKDAANECRHDLIPELESENEELKRQLAEATKA